MAAVTRDSNAVGLRLVIAYKLAKAGGELVLAGVLAFAEHGAVREIATLLGRHVTGAWSLHLSALLARASAPHAVALATVALVLDGMLTLGEGWALHRRFVWAPWVVVISTGSLLPFEVFELVRAPHPIRVLILVVNLGIVVYLAAHAIREIRGRPAVLEK